jgi:hypothetical protein
MSAVEIEEAVSELVHQPFDAAEFPFAFLEAYGNKVTTIKRLRKGSSNKSKVPGGVLQRNNIHLAVCAPGEVIDTLQHLFDAPETAKQKAKFTLATDGREVQAEDLNSGDTLACAYADLEEHFPFFFELAGISTVKEIRESAFDIKATSRLNKLYVELLKHNPDWAAAERREEMNHFMARLIFCFFAEDTNIFRGDNLFTGTVADMSKPDGSNVHEIIAECFRSMDTNYADKNKADIRVWARSFPYVNGQLFSGSRECPRFTKIARSYLQHVGKLNWKQINPDIFGSMIQAVADEDERSSLGMHYTSVPNILKVLNPLFLDDLREQLDRAGDNARKLFNLRKRLSRIRVFDPACGSGNFLVIAYKELRKIEEEVNKRREEAGRTSEIPITNFRGIEIKSFSAEVARLALIIAEYQCDVLYRGQEIALAEVLPLNSENWITTGNALEIDWLLICPPTGENVVVQGNELFNSPKDQAEVDFENEGGETYICGNPPYLGKGKKNSDHLIDMKDILGRYTKKYGYVDYVGCWFVKASEYILQTHASAAFVATNSICQGRQLPQLWPYVLTGGIEISFAHQSFKWANNASHNAGVICVIVGIALKRNINERRIFFDDLSKSASYVNPYLIDGEEIYVHSRPKPLSPSSPKMKTGSVPNDGGNLILSREEVQLLVKENPVARNYIHPFFGSQDILHAKSRNCLIIEDSDLVEANSIPEISKRLSEVASLRSVSKKKSTREYLSTVPHRFQHRGDIPEVQVIAIPSVSSENREWFPVALLPAGTVISNLAFMIIDKPIYNLSLLSSKLHLAWLATVCGKLKKDYRYSNTLGWNTFPLPKLTSQNKADLTATAEEILIARERHFPATIADLYAPDKMPQDLKRAHDRNDEVLERIYIGRRFKNDTERLEKLFELYTEMTEGRAN